MWQKVACLIHHIDRFLPIGNADVHMETKDQAGTGDLLHILNDGRVAVMRVISWSIQCENGCVPADAICNP